MKIQTKRILGVTAILSSMGLAACAGNGVQPASLTVSEVLAAPDDARVQFQAELVQQIDGEHFLLRDESGEVTVEIDNDLRGAVQLQPGVQVRVSGEVDRDAEMVSVDVETLQVTP